MLAVGNGTAQQCAFNLLSTIRGEVPFERCKGMSPELSDKPLTKVMGEMVTEIIWNLQNYEPRAEMEDINLIISDIARGQFRPAAGVSVSNG